MLRTSIGAFDGKSWEALCQQVFKKKYAPDGYQHIPASPGDFGLEGICRATGHGFQCYCPDRHYRRAELYEHQRDKITTDLGKLKKYQAQIEAILGSTKLRIWRFVTPEIDHNALLLHASAKVKEVRSWNLPFLAPDFSIELHDADYYIQEINEIRAAAGVGLDFSNGVAVLAQLSGPNEVYESNVLRKCKVRLDSKSSSPKFASLVDQLTQQTLKTFLESDGYFRNIERSAPTLYFKLARLINEFELYVQEQAITWIGLPEELTNHVRHELVTQLRTIGPEVTDATAAAIARHMVARWLAICSLDYD